MVNKKEELKYLDEYYNDSKETLYYKYNIVNISKAQERESELFNLNEYLPNLLRGFLSIDYYTRMEEANMIDDVLKKMGETRKYTREESVIEFINWIDTHKTFNDLLNEDKVKELGDDLEALEKEYNELKKKIK